MSTSFKSETKRGYQDASKQFELLRATWPLAFPAKPHEVRPLAAGSAKKVAEALGWSSAYARAVLRIWKSRETYCKAILSHPFRINLDGSATEEAVGDRAREDAKAQLEIIAARIAKKATKPRRQKGAEHVDLPVKEIEVVRTPRTAMHDAPSNWGSPHDLFKIAR